MQKTATVPTNGFASRARRRLGTVAVVIAAAVAVAGCAAGLSVHDAERTTNPSLLMNVRWDVDLTGGVDLWGSRTLQQSEAAYVPESDLLVTGTSAGDILALRGRDGEQAWSFQVGEPCEARPVIAQGRVFAACTNGMLYALELRSGKKVWEFDTGASVEAAVAVAGGLVVVTNSLNRVFALDAATGEFKWRKERSKVNDFTMYGHSAPLVADGVVYAGFSDGQLMAYELADGATRWGRDLSAGRARFRDLDTTPVLFDGDVFAASFAGGLYRLAAETGEVVWQRDLEGVSDLVAGEGVLYFTARDGAHAVDSETGEDYWFTPYDEDDVASAPTLGARYVFVSLRRRGLLVLERHSGGVVALVDLGSGFSASATLSDGRLFVQSNAGTLYGFDVADRPASL